MYAYLRGSSTKQNVAYFSGKKDVVEDCTIKSTEELTAADPVWLNNFGTEWL